ncbi:MAG: Ig-like domain-containing protein, partial [Gammaproteobacteria bacterium]|nr:Ig-like domain-containing protein [Gammaproteobacteria bacterium]
DTDAPTATLTDVPAKINSTTPFTATVTFNEAVTGFIADDITVTGGTAGTFTATSTTVYTLAVTPTSGSSVTVTVTADAATDGDANTGPATAVSATAVWDASRPTLDITGVPVTLNSTTDFTATFTFSEPVTGFARNDITVTGGTAGTFTATSATVYTLAVIPAGNTNVVVTVTADAASDGLNTGPASQQSATATWEVAVNSAPTVAKALPDRQAPIGQVFGYTFPADAFTDADTGDTLSYSATLSDGTALPDWLSFDDATRTFSGTPQSGDAGTLTVRVTADDNNGGTVYDEFDIVVAAAAATVSLQFSAGAVEISEDGNASVEVQLSEAVSAPVDIYLTVSSSSAIASDVVAVPAGGAVGQRGAVFGSAGWGARSVGFGQGDGAVRRRAIGDTQGADPVPSADYIPGTETAPDGTTGVYKVTIAAGDTTATLIIPIINDDILEANEFITVTIIDIVGVDGVVIGRGATITLVITIVDDEQSLVLVPATLTLRETPDDSFESTGTYALALSTEPTATVTVALAPQTSGVVTVSPASLTFNADNWNTAQQVRVTATDDDIDQAGVRSTGILHTLTSGDLRFNALSNTVFDVIIQDDDIAGLVFTPAALSMAEGGSGAYTVALATEPTGSVTVTVAGGGGEVTVDTDADTNGDQDTLTFNAGNWTRAQMVTVAAGQDDDLVNDRATLTHSAAGGGYDSVTGNVAVTVIEDDLPTVSLSVSAATVAEGGSVTFTATRSEPNTSGAALSIPIRVKAGATAEADDYTLAASISIANNAATGTTTFTATDDNVDEPPETVIVELHTLPDGHEAGAVTAQTVTLTDNDATEVTLAGAAGDVEEGGAKTFTVTLGRGLVNGEALEVPLTFAGAATRGTDYTTACASATGVTCRDLNNVAQGNAPRVTFTGPATRATATSVTLTLTALTDSATESGGETVVIGLGTLNAGSGTGLGGGATGADNLADFSITDPTTTDTTAPTLSISGIPATINSATPRIAIFTFSETVTDFVTGDVTVSGGTKGAFAGRGAVYTLVVTPTGGVDVTVTVQANAATDGTNAGPARAVSATMTWSERTQPLVTDLPEVSVASAASREGAAGALVFPVRLSAAPGSEAEAVVVDYITEAGTATRDVDYRHTSGTLRFGAGETVKQVAVSILDDEVVEGNETLRLVLSNPVNASLAQRVATGTILDDDSARLFLRHASADEGTGEMVFKMELVPWVEEAVTVDYTTVDRAALAGADYTAVSGTLTFEPGKTRQELRVPLIDDAVHEGTEQFSVQFSNLVNAEFARRKAVNGWIYDNDVRAVMVSPPGMEVTEGSTDRCTIRLATQPTGEVTLALTTNNPTVQLSPARLTFDASNWSQPQPVQVTAPMDTDMFDSEALMTYKASGADYEAMQGQMILYIKDMNRPDNDGLPDERPIVYPVNPPVAAEGL